MNESVLVDHNGAIYLLSRKTSNGWYLRMNGKKVKICSVRVDVDSAKTQAKSWLSRNASKTK